MKPTRGTEGTPTQEAWQGGPACWKHPEDHTESTPHPGASFIQCSKALRSLLPKSFSLIPSSLFLLMSLHHLLHCHRVPCASCPDNHGLLLMALPVLTESLIQVPGLSPKQLQELQLVLSQLKVGQRVQAPPPVSREAPLRPLSSWPQDAKPHETSPRAE